MGSKTTANQFVGKGRGVSLALIIVLFLLASASLGRRTLVVKADSARAANPSRISNCKPKPGAAAYWQLTHSTSPTAPPDFRSTLVRRRDEGHRQASRNHGAGRGIYPRSSPCGKFE